MIHPFFSGRYWWLSVAAIVLLTLIFFHGLRNPAPVPVTQTAPAITHQPAVKPPTTTRTSAPIPTHPVLELFTPSDENITHDQAVSRVRGELEQLFVIRILLVRCEMIDETQAANISSAAQSYATRTKLFSDSTSLLSELEAQAIETYQLVYARTSCNEASLQALKAQTLAWQAQYIPTAQ